jgi:mRNA interferase RelE/StbE
MAELTITPEAFEQFDRLPKTVRARIRQVIERLRKWPKVSGVKRLSGDLAGWYRARTGDYRIRFRVAGQRIVIDKIGHRKDIYEG